MCKRKNRVCIHSSVHHFIQIISFLDDRYQKEIPGESEKYGDILQGRFKDTPFENTRKFIMALDWVNQNLVYCRPRYILKTQVCLRI